MSRDLGSNATQAMPWAVILTAATLAVISAWLVFYEGWEPWRAFMVVAVTAFVIIFSLLAAILVLSSPEDRAENWRIFTSTARSDLALMMKYFRVRKRP
ncbi:MAG: hypothetical protein Q8K01_07940 [Sulfurimicrobium sp.]|nr:hypothetical protein [Sulfurimicrobium sp.]